MNPSCSNVQQFYLNTFQQNHTFCIQMDKARVHTSIEDLPEKFFYSCSFKYLAPLDIFNLGQCSRKLMNIVVHRSTHPLGTKLQYLKTKHKHFTKTPTVYDNMPCFNLMSKCSKIGCPCFKYHH